MMICGRALQHRRRYKRRVRKLVARYQDNSPLAKLAIECYAAVEVYSPQNLHRLIEAAR